MKIEQTEETLTPELQPVTWLGYVGTFIAIGLIWWIVWAAAALFVQAEELLPKGILVIGIGFGVPVASLGLCLALFITNAIQRTFCRWFAILMIPTTPIVSLNFFNISLSWANFEKTDALFVLILQGIIFGSFWVCYFLIRRARHHGV